MTDVRQLFLMTAAAALDEMEDPAVAAAWAHESVLPGMDVGALVAHTARALSTVCTYLDQGHAAAADTLLDAADYIVAVVADTGRDSDVNVGVRQRAVTAADAGPAAVLTAAYSDLATLREDLPHLRRDHTLRVKDDVAMLLDEYLRTRIVEMVVHHDDLVLSVDTAPRRPLPDEAGSIAVGVLAEVARQRSSTRRMIALLARRERLDGAAPRAL